MIVVSGTKRSGTSMWMQILVAAQHPFIGTKFPANWHSTIRGANPRGFYESKLSQGIYFRTNPDPRTGAYLFPGDTTGHAAKVFANGVIRSDASYLDRVIVTMRPWQEFTASLLKMRAMRPAATDLDLMRSGGAMNEPIIEWWSEYFALIRDIATRRYAAHFQPYKALLSDPERVIAGVFDWVGAGRDPSAGAAAVDESLYRNRNEELVVATPDVPPQLTRACDDLYTEIEAGRPLTETLVSHLNEVHALIRPLLAEHRVEMRRAVADRVVQETYDH